MWSALALALGACIGDGSSSGPTDGLKLEISSSGGPSVGPVPIEVTLSNRSDRRMTVVRPFVSPIFVRFTVIDTAGSNVLFVGPQLKLAPLDDEDFVDLEPGGVVTGRFDLAPLFDLQAGEYTVSAEYRNPPEGPHEGGRAFTAKAGEGIVADAITIEVVP